jgi:signal transduction histidine kinase
METLYSRKSRAERLITTGRAVLAGFFLLAIWLDPSEPSRYAQITYIILAGYLVYAFVLAIVTWRMEVPLRRFQIISHTLDLMVFASLMFLTEGPTSPFFVYFVFSLVCATLRWQWRGTLWTAVVALAAVISMAMYPTDLLRDPNFELNRFVIRVVYLAVVAILLGYLGAHEQKLRGDLSKLAVWPRTIPAEVREMVREMLEHAAAILGAPRMLLAWEERDEPQLHLASWSRDDFHYTRQPHTVFGTLVAEPLAGTSFFCPDACGPQPVVVHNSPAGLKRWQGVPFDPQLQKSFNIGAVLSLRLQGKKLEGYLFALDKPQMTSDDLLLGEIVARQALTRFEHFFLLKQIQQAATTEERIRLARDLHDGLLQSLTGVALQLETVHRLMEVDPQTARQRLLKIQRLIADEQRDLRSHIAELKPSGIGGPAENYELADRLDGLAERIRQQWDLSVDISILPRAPRITSSIGREIYFVVHESLINAVRHAGASVLKAQLTFESDRVRIIVTDNGKGFSFQGHFDHADLFKMKRGPVTLKERIADLRGTLSIDSGETGARLDITLPLMDNGV